MKHIVTDEASYAILEWLNPRSKKEVHPSYKVTFVRTTQYAFGGSSVPVRTPIDDWGPGDLYDGKQPGEASAWWIIPNVTGCSAVALWFSAPDMTRKQARSEVIRIVESLRPAP
jgi:hypothetical protein